MTRIHIQTPGACSTEEAVARAFGELGLPVMGGASNDGWSRMHDFQRCKYRYYLKHVLQVDAPPDEEANRPPGGPLDIGTVVHAALAVHRRRFLPGTRPQGQPSPLDFLDAFERVGGEFAVVRAARRLVYGYLEKYPDDEFEPLAIEAAAGVEGIHTCRFDWVARKRGEPGAYIIETKTSARKAREALECWFLDGEIIGEVYGWELLGLDKVFGPLQGTIIDLIFKTNPPDYHRLHVVIPRVVLEDYKRDRAHWGQVRNHYAAAGYWPRELSGCLHRYNDMCAFWAHCRDGNPTSSLVQIRSPHA